jgi:hypothetical protein
VEEWPRVSNRPAPSSWSFHRHGYSWSDHG